MVWLVLQLGRQTVAGINPLTIRLAGEDWLKATSVKEEHLKGMNANPDCDINVVS